MDTTQPHQKLPTVVLGGSHLALGLLLILRSQGRLMARDIPSTGCTLTARAT
ncbi:periplasmic copper-binding protein [Halanaeroarchaeum sulfurireducens]|uniref:Periplasmic copper-binding protein n=1 Tax=Halanaeroarchaeum sulfurireducens TaxID=1604004 RepID=A0A0F7PBU4_9EURY|nr:periplasmic copper-binding protein [Halanaeroarchaeum sulfurireducens]ALG82026.1 periplasmic copper-binding protein [Halanaeroarchaeum sulfurireducens]